MNINKKISVIAGMLIALIALVGATATFAQVPLVPEGAVSVQGDGDHHCDGDCLIDREKIKDAIAKALGISVEALQAARSDGKTLSDLAEEHGVDLEVIHSARQTALEEVIQQAVEDGLVSQEQAEDLLRLEAHQGPHGWRSDDAHHEHDGHGDHSSMAERLGITVDELQAARVEGKTLADLAEEMGIGLEEVRAGIRGIRAEASQRAVAKGRINFEQARKILSGEGRWGTCDNNQD